MEERSRGDAKRDNEKENDGSELRSNRGSGVY